MNDDLFYDMLADLQVLCELYDFRSYSQLLNLLDSNPVLSDYNEVARSYIGRRFFRTYLRSRRFERRYIRKEPLIE